MTAESLATSSDSSQGGVGMEMDVSYEEDVQARQSNDGHDQQQQQQEEQQEQQRSALYRMYDMQAGEEEGHCAREDEDDHDMPPMSQSSQEFGGMSDVPMDDAFAEGDQVFDHAFTHGYVPGSQDGGSQFSQFSQDIPASFPSPFSIMEPGDAPASQVNRRRTVAPRVMDIDDTPSHTPATSTEPTKPHRATSSKPANATSTAQLKPKRRPFVTPFVKPSAPTNNDASSMREKKKKKTPTASMHSASPLRASVRDKDTISMVNTPEASPARRTPKKKESPYFSPKKGSAGRSGKRWVPSMCVCVQ
jgi:hypothetical protein